MPRRGLEAGFLIWGRSDSASNYLPQQINHLKNKAEKDAAFKSPIDEDPISPTQLSQLKTKVPSMEQSQLSGVTNCQTTDS
jgi:hypothetical protein